MEMQSNEIGKLLVAFSKAKNTYEPIQQTGWNPHFKSKYSTLDDYFNATRLAMAKNDLDIIHQIITTGDKTEVVATLYHSSGEFIRSALPVNMGNNIQQVGSAITYCRRYTVQSLLGVEGDRESDDDGEAAVKPEQDKPKETASKDSPSLGAAKVAQIIVGIMQVQTNDDLDKYWISIKADHDAMSKAEQTDIVNAARQKRAEFSEKEEA